MYILKVTNMRRKKRGSFLGRGVYVLPFFPLWPFGEVPRNISADKVFHEYLFSVEICVPLTPFRNHQPVPGFI